MNSSVHTPEGKQTASGSMKPERDICKYEDAPGVPAGLNPSGLFKIFKNVL
jgi:hypothetical protein